MHTQTYTSTEHTLSFQRGRMETEEILDQRKTGTQQWEHQIHSSTPGVLQSSAPHTLPCTLCCSQRTSLSGWFLYLSAARLGTCLTALPSPASWSLPFSFHSHSLMRWRGMSFCLLEGPLHRNPLPHHMPPGLSGSLKLQRKNCNPFTLDSFVSLKPEWSSPPTPGTC